MMNKWEDYAQGILDSIPEAIAVACDECGDGFWYEEIPKRGIEGWNNEYGANCIGHFQCDNWEESLLVKKWKPQDKEDYYFINFAIPKYIGNHRWINDRTDNRLLAASNCFKTREEAEKKLKQVLEVLK